MNTTAIIVAAGRGVRAGEGLPKQYRPIGGVPVLRRTLEAFLAHPGVDQVLVVIHPDDQGLYEAATEGLELLSPEFGGASRQESVLNGLISLTNTQILPGTVLIHDAARAFVDAEVISRVIEAVETSGEGAIPALPVADTLKKGSGGHVDGTVERDGLWRAQTPQGFPFQAILEAHQAASGRELTDDAAVAEAAGLPVRIVEGSERNIKLTRPEDFDDDYDGNSLDSNNMLTSDIRTGFGYDVHAFEAGTAVTLCGVEIPYDKTLKGHSDADVAMHALTDAILGAVSAGDIGDHFPPSDPQWKGAASHVFLEHAVGLVSEAGGSIRHMDVTMICETPKIGPYRLMMRQKLAEITGLDVARISVKATTTEKLGFTGRGEGIAAQAVATVELGGRNRHG